MYKVHVVPKKDRKKNPNTSIQEFAKMESSQLKFITHIIMQKSDNILCFINPHIMLVDNSPFAYEQIPSTVVSSGCSKNERYEQCSVATNASWAVNWFLFVIKLYVFILSSSKAIAAALVDSAGNGTKLLYSQLCSSPLISLAPFPVDLISQMVLKSAENRVQEVSE
jgi:hypothetical protein